MNYLNMGEREVPVVGLGTWDLRGSECVRSVRTALELGYRLIDTAEIYANEKEVGEAVQESGIDREDIILTTKVWTNNLRYDDCLGSLHESLKKLRMDYVDLYLIHWPTDSVPLEETMKAMDRLLEEGMTRAIGVSNFNASLLDQARLMSAFNVVCDQVKYHPFISQAELLEYCQGNGVVLTAYSPLARGRVRGNPVLEEIGKRYGKNASQVALRWLIQQPWVQVIPKAAGRKHQQENIDIFDFELTHDEMAEIFTLNEA